MEKKEQNIEVRSENIQNIVGQIPPFLIRFGNMILLFIIILLMSIAVAVPFPRNMQFPVYWKNIVNDEATVYIPYDMLNKLQNGMVIDIELVAYPYKKFNLIKARMHDFEKTRIIIGQELFVESKLKILTGIENKKELKEKTTLLEGKAIVRQNLTFLENLLKK